MYIFNVTNQERFLSEQDQKLHVEEIGPIVFRYFTPEQSLDDTEKNFQGKVDPFRRGLQWEQHLVVHGDTKGHLRAGMEPNRSQRHHLRAQHRGVGKWTVTSKISVHVKHCTCISTSYILASLIGVSTTYEHVKHPNS